MQTYINKILDPEIRKNVQLAYDSLPEYFRKVPASSSGKYHPSFSLGDGGLVRHTRFACDLAIELFQIVNFTDIEKDIVLASLILHDGLKYGIDYDVSKYKIHDNLMADWLDDKWNTVKNCGVLKIITDCIRSHMGQWASTVQPSTKLEKFVHWCDYVASRKFIDNYYEVVR